MNNKKIWILILSLIIMIAFSSLIFFGLFENEKNSVQLTSFIFIILTEIISFSSIGVVVSKKFNTFINSGILSTTFLYAVSSAFINILTSPLFVSSRKLTTVNIAILLIYLFIIAIIFMFRKENK